MEHDHLIAMLNRLKLTAIRDQLDSLIDEAGRRELTIRGQYFPKGTDLSMHSADDIAAVAAALNTRPRKTLAWQTPAEALDQLLISAMSSDVRN